MGWGNLLKPLITGFFGFLNLPLPYQKINNYIKKFAFTLAEVLITLGVIGVVAAMTIPTLITSYQKHVVENGTRTINPRNKFQFQFTKKTGINSAINSSSFVEPYIYQWNGKMEHLKNGNTWACKKDCTNCGYCTKWIQLNGWKIPKDYPW